jgi:hypothetical protein
MATLSLSPALILYPSANIYQKPSHLPRGILTKNEKTCNQLHGQLAKCGNQPKNFLLDNEVSHDLKKTLKKYHLEYQLVPPHLHRRNTAERAIHTYKNHLLACLATCDPIFPVSEWDQVGLTLNLLRFSRANPKLSASAYLHGNFDFNKTPLVPMGTKVLVHLKPDKQPSWAYHGTEGWYVGPSMEHY